MQIIRGTPDNDTLIGLPGATGDSIFGDAGDDSITGGSASTGVSIFGEAGNDTLIASTLGSDNTFDGGAGNDELVVEYQTNAVLWGGPGDDVLRAIASAGTSFDGGAGNDTISMGNRSGGDVGDATLTGGAGDDLLFGFMPSDLLIWDAGNDTIYGSGPGATLRIDLADVSVKTRIPELNLVYLTDGTQTAEVRDVDTFILNGETLAFDDLIAPTAQGTAGDDLLLSVQIRPNIDALAGNDWITLGFESGTVAGGAGRDMLSFANVTLETAQVRYQGFDRPIFLNTTLTSDGGHSVSFSGIEGITGTSYADDFRATEGLSLLRGLGGRDFFDISESSTPIHVDGGASKDTISYLSTSSDALSASLLRAKGWASEAQGDTYANVENLHAGRGDDTLTGDHGDNTLNGHRGDDVLIGNAGDDHLIGWSGTDTAIFSYARDLYEIEVRDSNISIVTYIGVGPGDGQDTVESIEILHFADGDFML